MNCSTPGCNGRVERPTAKYCEECCFDQIGEEIEQRPIGNPFRHKPRQEPHDSISGSKFNWQPCGCFCKSNLLKIAKTICFSLGYDVVNKEFRLCMHGHQQHGPDDSLFNNMDDVDIFVLAVLKSIKFELDTAIKLAEEK